MPIFEVQLAEIRRLVAYVEAKTSAAAKREARKAWAKTKDAVPLPFKVLVAKLYRPSLSAIVVDLKPRAQRHRRSRRAKL